MDSVADFINIQSHNIGWLNQEIQSNRLFVDENFQRRYVWKEADKIKLIETILLGYAIPEVYLWVTGIDTSSGLCQRSIVDGQQRLFAINGFINNEFCLKDNVLECKNQSYSNKYFSELDEEYKKKIFGYKISVRMIDEKITKNQIIDMFNRLNCTAYNLTPQELRNAKYNGKFLKLSIHIANNSFWSKYNFFSGMSVRRMKDVEFMSNILIYFRQGISGDLSQENLNSVYNLYESEYSEINKDEELFKKVIQELQNMIDQTGEEKSFIKFLKRTTHLYSIITVIAHLIEKNTYNEVLRDKLIEFINNYNNINENSNLLLHKYRSLSLEGTKSKVNRIERFETILGYIAAL